MVLLPNMNAMPRLLDSKLLSIYDLKLLVLHFAGADEHSLPAQAAGETRPEVRH